MVVTIIQTEDRRVSKNKKVSDYAHATYNREAQKRCRRQKGM